MSSKVLFMQYPPITSYPKLANFLSCQLQYDKSMEWYFEHYFNLFAKKTESKNCYIDFYAPYAWTLNPFIKSENISRELVNTSGLDIIEFFMNSIDLGYYIYLHLNHFYIKASRAYNQVNHPHDTFIYGYNRNEQIFNIADFFNNGAYTYTTASFDEVNSAYCKIDLTGTETHPVQGILLVKPIDQEWYQYDKNRTITSLSDYLSSKTSYDEGYANCLYMRYDYPKQNLYYGIEIYDYLTKYLLERIGDEEHCDVRGYHTFSDHKKLIQIFIKYLLSNGYISTADYLTEADKICDLSLKIRNCVIKYGINKSKKVLHNAISMLNETKEIEIQLFEKMIHILENKC